MKRILGAACVAGVVATGGVAQADPSFGFGLNYVFGGDWAVGVRIFHDDEPGSAVLALGADYKFGSQAFRPTVGVAYLEEDYYIDLSLGYDTRLQALDYGIGGGASFEVEEENAAAPVTVSDPSPTPTGPTDDPT